VLLAGTYAYLAHTDHGGLCTDANGYDIAFYADADGTTPLYWEIESYNHETGAVVFWVKVSLTTAADKVFYVFYGNAAVSTFQSTASSAWNAAFLGVYHLGDPVTQSLSGSTATPRNLTKTGTVDPGTGQINGAGVWPASGTNYLEAADDAAWDVTNALTLSAWINTSSASYRQILDRDGGGAPSGGRSFQYRLNAGKLELILFISGVKVFTSTNTYNNGAWRYVVATYDGSNVNLYVDGAAVAPSPFAQTGNNDASARPFRIGMYGGATPSNVFIGSIDEPRFAAVCRSADWIATEYNNQSDPSTFYAVGDQAEYGVARSFGALIGS
jgi:hypothetical protein